MTSAAAAQAHLDLDVASAAPWHPAALAAHAHVAEAFPADPSRMHAPGRAARDLLERCRAVVVEAFGASDVVFTSGGTEAIHLAVRGAVAATAPARVASLAVEHSAVLAAADASGAEHVHLAVDEVGRVLPEAVPSGVGLVNVQHANHEVGTIQPVAATADRAGGALVHVDACQTAGRLAVRLEDLHADYLSISGAKFGAGRGVGALVLGPRARLRAMLTGDERERRRRSGLENLPGVAALAETLLALRPGDPSGPAAAEAARADTIRRHLRARLAKEVPDLAVHGPETGTLPHLVAVSALYCDGSALLAALDARGLAVHSGSSCATGGEPSHVLVAMSALTHGHVRLSFGSDVGRPEADRVVDAVAESVAELRDRLRR